MAESFKYHAFISYSHKDRSWGDWLHKALEGYRIPKRLIGTPGVHGPVPASLFPVFRDREELPSSADLSSQIRAGLEQSAHLIVICSRNAANSRWVNEEILAYKRLGREDRILALIADGEPNAAERPELNAEECFPEALKFRIGSEGRLLNERTEPIAADARPQGDGRDNAKLKLIAGLLGIGFDALKQRELEAARRRLRIFQSIAAAMLLLAVGAGTAAYFAYANAIEAQRQRDTAEKERAEAEKDYSLALDQAAFSVPLLVDSYRDGAVSTDLMKQLIEHSEKALGGLGGESNDVKAARAQVLNAMSLANVALGDSASAERFARQAIDLAEGLRNQDSLNVAWLRIWARSRARLSDALFWKGDKIQSLKQVQIAVDETAKGSQAFPDNEDLSTDLIDDYQRMGDILRGLGQLDAAADADRKWIEVDKGLLQRAPEEPKRLISLASGEMELGDTLEQEGNIEEAAGNYADCIAIAKKVESTTPQNGANLENLANCELRAGDAALARDKRPEASGDYRAALTLSKTLSDADTANFKWREILEVSHQRIGDVLLLDKDYDGALKEFTAYRDIANEALPRAPNSGTLRYDVAVALQKRGDAFRDKRDFKDAETEYGSSLSIAHDLAAQEGASIGGWHKLLALNYQRLGVLFDMEGDRAKALQQFQSCAATPVNRFVWTPRTITPPDVTAFCTDKIKEAGGDAPHQPSPP